MLYHSSSQNRGTVVALEKTGTGTAGGAGVTVLLMASSEIFGICQLLDTAHGKSSFNNCWCSCSWADFHRVSALQQVRLTLLFVQREELSTAASPVSAGATPGLRGSAH